MGVTPRVFIILCKYEKKKSGRVGVECFVLIPYIQWSSWLPAAQHTLPTFRQTVKIKYNYKM